MSPSLRNVYNLDTKSVCGRANVKKLKALVPGNVKIRQTQGFIFFEYLEKIFRHDAQNGFSLFSSF